MPSAREPSRSGTPGASTTPAEDASAAAELASLVHSIEEAERRLRDMSERYERAKREEVVGALVAAERTLRNAVRELDRAKRFLR